MNSGFIFLHRKILDWEWYGDEKVFRVFLHLLLKANHREGKWQGVVIKRGQLITSYSHVSEQLSNRFSKTSPQQVRTTLYKLKSTGEITVKTTNKYSVITINNYDEYQSDNRREVRQTTGKQQANNRQVTTNNNENNKDNENKRYNTVPAKADTSLYLDTFNQLTGRNFEVTLGRTTKLKKRLKTYTMDQILTALRNMVSDPFYTGENDRSWSADPDFLIKSDEQIDRFLNKGMWKRNVLSLEED